MSSQFSPKVVIPLTLIYIRDGDRILLMQRAAHKIFQSQWMGIGGKVEAGEDIVTSARREALEETGLTLTNMRLRGVITIMDETEETRQVFIFIADRFEGKLLEQIGEGRLAWHPISKLGELPQMVANQNLFLSAMLNDDNYYYYGFLILNEGKVITHASSDAYFANRPLRKPQ